MPRSKKPEYTFLDRNPQLDKYVQQKFGADAHVCPGCKVRSATVGTSRRRHRVKCVPYHALMVATAEVYNLPCVGLGDHPDTGQVTARSTEIRRVWATEQQAVEVGPASCTVHGVSDPALQQGDAHVHAARRDRSPEVEPEVEGQSYSALETAAATNSEDCAASVGLDSNGEDGLVTEVNQPIFEGSECSVGKAAVLLLEMTKIERTCTDDLVDAICKYISTVVLPQGNKFPSSLYKMERLCSVQKVDKFESYQCWQCQGYVFPASKGQDREGSPRVECGVCRALQYETKEYGDAQVSKSIRVAPAFYHIDLPTLISEYFFSNTTFCSNYATEECMEQEFFARGLQKSQLQQANPLHIPEVCRLEDALGGITVGPNRKVFCMDIGHDGFNPFNNGNYSVWGVWARCRNVSPQFLASKCNMFPVMLLHPKADIHSCMELIAKELRRYMPLTPDGEGGETIRVYDRRDGEYLDIHVVLTGVFADGPARDKLTLALGHTASLGCYWCCLPGQKQRTIVDQDGVATKDIFSAVRFLGNATPVPCHKTVFQRDMNINVSQGYIVGDPDIVYTPNMQRRRMRAAQLIREEIQSKQIPVYEKLHKVRQVFDTELDELRQEIVRVVERQHREKRAKEAERARLAKHRMRTAVRKKQRLQAGPVCEGVRGRRDHRDSTTPAQESSEDDSGDGCDDVVTDAYDSSVPTFVLHAPQRQRGPKTRLSDDIVRKADEIAARLPDTVVGRFPTLRSDICLLAQARAEQELNTTVSQNKLSIHNIPSKKFVDIGIKGYCSFVSMLPYVCPNNLFVLPVAHMLMYGVIRDINKYILTEPKKNNKYALTKEQKDLVVDRARGVYSASDFPNSYTEILENHKTWKLKHWVDWCDVHVRTIMRGIIIGGDHVFTELYHKLHRAALYFCKSSVGHYTRDPRVQFREQHSLISMHAANIRAYAAYVERFVDKDLCKMNLHLSVCRLPQQAWVRGSTGEENELWIERCAGFLRKVSRNRAQSSCVENVLMKSLLYVVAVQVLQTQSGTEWVSLDKDMAAGDVLTTRKERMAAAYGALPSQIRGGVQPCTLVGPRKAGLLGEGQLQNLKKQLLHEQQSLGLQGYAIDRLAPEQVSVFAQAKLSNSTVVSSTIYMREIVSQSYWVNVYYGPEWPITPCRVKHYIRITGLKHRRGTKPDLDIDLAVVEVFMCNLKLPYPDDAAMNVAVAERLPQPTEDEIITFVVSQQRNGVFSEKQAAVIFEQLRERYSTPPVNQLSQQRLRQWKAVWDEACQSRVWRFTTVQLQNANITDACGAIRTKDGYDITVVPRSKSLQVMKEAFIRSQKEDSDMRHAVVFDLHKSLDQDSCPKERGFETLVLLESVQSQLTHFQEMDRYEVWPRRIQWRVPSARNKGIPVCHVEVDQEPTKQSRPIHVFQEFNTTTRPARQRAGSA